MKAQGVLLIVSMVALGAHSLVVAGEPPSDASAAATPKSVSERWRIPKLVESRSVVFPFVVSDSVSRWLEGQKDIVKSVSPGTGPIVRDEKLYSRAGTFLVTGTQGRWRLTVYQANSREYALGIGRSFVELTQTRAVPNLEWNGRKIGDVSVGHHVRGMDDEPWHAVTFVRGNVAVSLASKRIDGKHHDPRPLAAMIDAYLLGEPITDDEAAKKGSLTLGDEAAKKESLTLGLEAAKDTVDEKATGGKVPEAPPIVKGTRYVLTVSPVTATRDKEGAEQQVRVTHGEVAKLPSGAFQVQFNAAGKQEVKYYCMSADGAVIAYGRLEVVVEEPAREENE